MINGPLNNLDEGSARPRAPYWLLLNAGEVYVIELETGVMALCLFKSVMDAEEFRHSLWVPSERPAGKWKPFTPGLKTAIRILEDLVARGSSHVAINPLPTVPSLLGPHRLRSFSITLHPAGISRISIPP